MNQQWKEATEDGVTHLELEVNSPKHGKHVLKVDVCDLEAVKKYKWYIELHRTNKTTGLCVYYAMACEARSSGHDSVRQAGVLSEKEDLVITEQMLDAGVYALCGHERGVNDFEVATEVFEQMLEVFQKSN